jgi:hypothetical protein
MFFHIDKNFNPDFPCHWQLGEFHVSTDTGWSITHRFGVKILYKGYADAAPLDMLLEDIICQRTPKLLGNFCVIAQVDGALQIQTDRYRSFPIYLGDHKINNLVRTDRVAWTDSLIAMDRDFDIIEDKFDVIGTLDISRISLDHALDQVHEILTNKTIQFLQHNQLPIKVFLSGGVDTMLVYSYLAAAGADFELIDYEHLEHDQFWRSNSHHLIDYWGYQQTHHWRTPCVLASGAPGDEFMLRSPVTANSYLLYHATSIPKILNKSDQEYLHRGYFALPKHLELFDQQIQSTGSLQDLHHELCNIIVNDWQHWHLGNTIHWTPLRDLDIFKIIMRLPLEDCIHQIMDSSFSRILMERNGPGVSKLLSNQKNVGPVFKNLSSLFDRS